METLFNALDTLVDLPFPAFEKKLAKFEEEFKNISVSDISEEELESYFTRVRAEYEWSAGDAARTRLALLGYVSHFDTLIEKFFPDYVLLFQASFERIDREDMARANYGFLEHLDEILREYTHRLSEPDRYPSYTGYIQELIQNSMIDLFFWLQDQESEAEKKASASDRNTDIAIKNSAETKNSKLQFIRQCLELLNEGVLEKIFFDHEYPIRVSPVDPELHLLGRYVRKK
jgi:hypothetical protein